MIEYVNADLYLGDSVEKQLLIAFDGGQITNEDLYSENMELAEGICSEDNLVFGACEASTLKFRVANIFVPLFGKWLDVSMTLKGDGENPFQLGRYKVADDKPTADRRYRDIVAYDAMYDIIHADVADWYNEILPNEDSTVSMRQFRSSFVAHFGLEQAEIELVNDAMLVSKTIQPEELSGKSVITAICEINGCFGRIGRDGRLHYIYLQQSIEGVYPSNDLYPSVQLYPRAANGWLIGRGTYISPCQYEDYIVESITQLQIRKEENDAGATVGTEGNLYVIQGNFLVYGKGSEELSKIAENILAKIEKITYRPFSAQARGNPCIEVGDTVRLNTRYERIESYVFTRVLKGIQALKDSYESTGEKTRTQNLNSTAAAILELKGKTNIITRTIEENRAEVKDIEAGLRTTILQTAEELQTEAENTEAGLRTQILQTASEVKMEALRAQEAEAALGIKADKITLSVADLKSSIDSELLMLSDRIALKVESGTVQNMIDISLAGATILANQIRLEGYTTINGGFSIDTSGNATLETSQARAYLSDRTLRIRDLSTLDLIAITPTNIQFVKGGSYGYSFASFDSSTNQISVNATSAHFNTATISSANMSYLYVDTLVTSGNSDTIDNRIAWLKSQVASLSSRISALESV